MAFCGNDKNRALPPAHQKERAARPPMSLYVHCPACPRVLRPRSDDPEACWTSLKQHLKTVGSRCASHKRASEALFTRTPARCPVCREAFTSAKEAVIHCCSAPDGAHVAFRSAPPARMDAHEAVVREQKEAAVFTAALKLASKMYAAAKSGRSDEVMEHLRNGADPNGGGEDGFTPLMTACEAGHEAVVDVLLSHGACQINKRNSYGQTALCLAAINGRTAVVLRLLQDECVDVECVGGGLSVAEKARKAGFTGLADILARAATDKQVGKILRAVTEGCASGTFDSLTQRVETLSTGLGAVRREKSEDEVAVYSDKLCTVCLTQPIEMVITPCFHACLCAQCAGANSAPLSPKTPLPYPPTSSNVTDCAREHAERRLLCPYCAPTFGGRWSAQSEEARRTPPSWRRNVRGGRCIYSESALLAGAMFRGVNGRCPLCRGDVASTHRIYFP